MSRVTFALLVAALAVGALLELLGRGADGGFLDLYEKLPKALLYLSPFLLLLVAARPRYRFVPARDLDLWLGATTLVALLSYFAAFGGFRPVNPPLTLLGGLALYLLVRQLPLPPPRTLAAILTALVVLVTVEAGHALWQWVHGAAPAGDFLNQNLLAMYLALAVPLATGVFLAPRSPLLLRWVCAAALPSLLAVVYLSKCRTAVLALAVTLPLLVHACWRSMLWRLVPPRARRPLYFGTAVAFAGALAGFLRYLIWMRPESVFGRLLTWKVALRSIAERPWLGAGEGRLARALTLAYGDYFSSGRAAPGEEMLPSYLDNVCNEFLAIPVEGGLVGALIALPLWTAVAVLIWRRLHLGPPRASEPAATAGSALRAGMAGSLLVFLVCKVTYFPSAVPAMLVPFLVLLALLARDESRPLLLPTPAGRPPRRLPLLAVATALVAVTLPFVLAGARQAHGMREWERARQLAARDGESQRAVDVYQRLLPSLDHKPDFLRDYAELLMRRGDADGAVTLLERAAADDPDPYLLEELAAARAAAGRLAAAREALLSARSIYPWRLTTKWMLAELALQAGDDDEALRFATELAVTPAKLRNSRALELKRQARRLTERLAGAGDTASGDPGAPWRSLATALRLAGDRAPALRRTLASAPAAHRPALRFLIRNMPERDLLRVDTAFLRRHVAAAHATRGRYRFQEVVPEDVFVRYVVPYSQMGEAPEEWRGYLRDELERFVRAAETPEEAIYALKYEALDHLGVRYTDRYLLRSILAPRETVEWGYYNCYNGSIVLADALRAFGIPSRIVTIPEWVGMAAGHAWVEAHVHGAWRSIGVADLSRLDDSWFHERAARTDPELPKHRIYAASFERTDLQLPRFGADAWWEDVTERYTRGSGGRS